MTVAFANFGRGFAVTATAAAAANRVATGCFGCTNCPWLDNPDFAWHSAIDIPPSIG